MYQQQSYSGYQHISSFQHQQQYNYNAPSTMATSRPRSPSEQSERNSTSEEDYYNLPGPPPTSHIWNGLVWALEVVQHPQRARMCGFGDKDRRPISPPPCIRLIIMDPSTKQEIKYDDLELAHLVLAVDIWDLNAQRELNLVKQSTASPCISSAATGAFPTQSTQPPQGYEQPHAYPINQIPGYQGYPRSSATPGQSQSSTNTYYDQGSNSFPPQGPNYINGHNGHSSPYQNGAPNYGTNQYQYGNQQYASQAANPYGQHLQQPQQGNQQSAITSHTQATPDGGSQGGQPPTQLFTRNLIGSLSASAFRLNDEHGKPGIWFVLQDLSVRTEGWFRLKFNFFNLSHSVESQLLGKGVNGDDSNNNNNNNGGKSNNSLAEATAPCLASAFSNPFKVFSAKKFPGVVESTPLSRAFATQGIKIPIRKDTQGGSGKRGRDGSDDEENNSDMEG